MYSNASVLGEELACFVRQMCENIPEGAVSFYKYLLNNIDESGWKITYQDIVNDLLGNENDSQVIKFIGKEYFKQMQYNLCHRHNIICNLCKQRLEDDHDCPVIKNKHKIQEIVKNNQNGTVTTLIVKSNEIVELSANIEHIFDYMIIEQNGTLKIKQEDIDEKPSALIIIINNDLILENDAMIDVSASGYFDDTNEELNIGRGGDGVEFGGGGGYANNGMDGHRVWNNKEGWIWWIWWHTIW